MKAMVTNVVRSGLIELPAPPPPSASAASSVNSSPDPWHNIFRTVPPRHVHPFHPAPGNDSGGGDLDDLGMYDAEDGGIYRCIDCMHEIWGGACSNCERIYPGHAGPDDEDEDEDDLDDDEIYLMNELPGRRRRFLRNIFSMIARSTSGPGGHDLDPESFGVEMFGEEGGGEDEDFVSGDFEFSRTDEGNSDLDEDSHHEVTFAAFTDPEDAPNEGAAQTGGVSEEEEEERYEGSFIDDSEVEDDGRDSRPTFRSRDGATLGKAARRVERIVVSEDEEEEYDSATVARNSGRDSRPRRRRRSGTSSRLSTPEHLRRGGTIVISSDGDDDSSEEQEGGDFG